MEKGLETTVLEQPKKGLFNRAKRAIGRGLMLASLPVLLGVTSLVGCKGPFVPNEPPTPKEYSVSPNVGTLPFPAQIVYEGEDPEGDSIEYSVYADYNGDNEESSGERIIDPQPDPINRQFTFTTPGDFNIYGKMVDAAGNAIQTRLGEVNVSEPEEPPQPPVDNDYLDISLQVFNNESTNPLFTTEAGRKAKVKVFDSANETTPLDGILQTDASGNLVYTSAKKVSELSGVTVTAVLVDESGSPISYEHTLRYPAGDLTDVKLKPHPEPTFAPMEDYAEHYRGSNTGIVPETGQKKWDLEGKVNPDNALKKIGIFTTHPVNGSYSFSPSQDTVMRDKTKASDDIEVAIRGSNLPDTNEDGFPDLDGFILQGEPQAGVHYDLWGTPPNQTIFPRPGYILVAPNNSISNSGQTNVFYQNGSASGIINRALIEIKPTLSELLFERVFSHELGKHAFTNPYDLKEPYNLQITPGETILRYDTPNTKLGQGVADIEDAYVANEELYKFAASSDDFLRIPQPGSWN